VGNPRGSDMTGGVGAARSVRIPFQPIRFGKYFLMDKVAVGGMAEIFRAKTFGHAGFEKVVVIKRILSQYASNHEFVDMFIDEAKLSVELTHPNIVQIYDFGKIENSLFIAMESVQGKDLRSVLRRLAERGKYMPHEVAAFITHEMACGLDFAHKKTDGIGLPLNIVHRDISPSNVLLSYGGHVKVLDFGIAKAESASESTESGVLKGKFQYMSPEQTNAESVDHRSDIFSLGICLWEMLTGNRLFKCETGLQSLDLIRSGNYPLPSEYNPNIPGELEEICMHALDPDASQRYQEAYHVSVDLQDYLLKQKQLSPSSLAPLVSNWVRGFFGEEILRERERLDRGTELVNQLKDSNDLTFSGASRNEAKNKRRRGGSNITRKRKKKRKQTSGLLLAGSVIVVLLTLLLVTLLIMPMVKEQAPVSELGTLIVDVRPGNIDGLQILLDGQDIGTPHDRVEPGIPHQLVISAPGYEQHEKSGLELVANQTYLITVELEEEQLSALALGSDAVAPTGTEDPKSEAEKRERREARRKERKERKEREAVQDQAARTEADDEEADTDSQPASRGTFLDPNVSGSSDASKAPVIEFRSDPRGAKVYIDGRKQGTTPFTWTDGEAGKLYNIQFRKDGYVSVQAAVNAPRGGQEVRLERQLERKDSADTGTLSVRVSAGYANVYIDGEFIGPTPLIGNELSAGSHKVRVVNKLDEIDITDSVTIRGGKHVKKTFDLSR